MPIETYIKKREEEFRKYFISNDMESGLPTYTQHPESLIAFNSETIATVLRMVKNEILKHSARIRKETLPALLSSIPNIEIK